MAEKISEEYRTDTGYEDERMRSGGMTPAAEDYLEMIYRLSGEGKEPVRICELAKKLSVTPSSASRMARLVAGGGFAEFKRYGYIMLSDAGIERGAYLTRRHETVMKFLSRLTGLDMSVETERIEHYLSENTVAAMEASLQKNESAKRLEVKPSNQPNNI